MIIINEPKLTKENKKIRISSEIEINNNKTVLWFEFDDRFSKYIVKDRCDAFLIAVLPMALRMKKDIICNSTVSEELLHNLRKQLIPALTKGSVEFYKTRISADINKKDIQTAEAVGTGLSLGVNSLHVLSQYLEPEYPDSKLTHVLINDYLQPLIDGADELNASANKQVLKSIELAQELDLYYVHVKTNLLKDFDYNYSLDHIYSDIAPVFVLQKLFKYYFIGSSGWDYNHFTLKYGEKRDCSFFGLLISSSLSISNIKIYLEGGEKDYLEKIEDILHFAPAQRYLHSCARSESKNCNSCYKCKRALLALDALDRVDYFSQVYDTEYYKKNRLSYISYLEKAYDRGDRMIEHVYKLFEKKNMLTKSRPTVHLDDIQQPENINSSAVILKDITTNDIVMSKQTKAFMPAVCIGKIITALIALDSGKSQLVVDIPDNIFNGVSRVSLYDLIRYMILTPKNSVADIIAENVFGSVSEFVDAMNDKARALHAYSTKFTNPFGYGQGNFTTADDVVKIMEYALRNLHFRKIFKSSSFNILSGDSEVVINTVNPILKSGNPMYIPECIAANYGVQGILANHVAFFKKDEHIYLLVLLGIKDPKNELFRIKDVHSIISCVL